MKKLFLSLIMCLLLLTGCGVGATKTMKCTSTTTNGNITSKTTYNVDYQDNEIKKVRVTYNYHSDTINDNNGNATNEIDGVGTGTDGTTNDTKIDNDGIIDGVFGSAIDTIISGVADTILDIAGLRDRHATVQSTYGNMPGFSVQTTNDATDNDYMVTYVIDYDTISDDDLASLNLSRDLNALRSTYSSQGFTCNE